MWKGEKDNNMNDWLPPWLRIVLIIIAVLYLLLTMLNKGGLQREDFPSFNKF